MIAWLFKNWKLFLDIIVVVGVIVLFTIFDPFGIFSNRKLKNTANILSSVKDIGELVTAEYYGEVISSLHGTQIYDLEVDSLNPEFENCFIELKSLLVSSVLETLGDQTRLRKRQKTRLFKDNVEKKLVALKTDYKPNDIYNHLIVFLGYHNIRNDESFFYDAKNKNPDKKLDKNAEERVCEFLLGEIYLKTEQLELDKKELMPTEFSDYIYEIPTYFDGIADFHYKLNNQQIRKKNRDIVFIGRGWVKAGFKFEKLNESNFYFDSKYKIIRFYGLSPVILDHDINPWFIPEKKVKGYELVDFYKKATFEEAKEVKIRCKEELLEQAYKADILNQAQVNGEESLRDFFALLTNEPDLKVEFRALPFQKELNAISSDTLITVNEALLIDSIVQKLTVKIIESISPEKEYYKEQLSIFTNQLKEMWFLEKGIPFNLFMTEAAKILNHKLYVTRSDYDFLVKLRSPIILKEKEKELVANFTDTIKYNIPYPEFVTGFNNMLDVLETEVSEVDDYRTDTFKLDLIQFKKLNPDTSYFDTARVSYRINTDTITYYKIALKNKERGFNFTDLKYPVLSIPESSYKLYKMSDTIRVDSLVNSYVVNSDIITGDPYGDSLRKKEIATIKSYESSKIKHEIITRPVKRLTSGIKKIFN